MPPIPPQVVQITCPNCRTPIRAAVYTLIDVGEQPELKAALLSGQLNMAGCQNCGFTSMLAAPLIYHDPAKQLCLTYVPQELNARPDEQERFIGDATSYIIRSLPPEAPRGYLLTPRSFISLASLVDTVLEADGISREMVEQQRGRVELISRLAEVMEDEVAFAQLVQASRAQLTLEFFATLDAFITASSRDQREEAEVLLQLRDQLVALVGEPGEMDEEDADLEAALDRLVAASDDELPALIGELRPIIDYTFFETLTARIDEHEAASEAAEAQHLTERRTTILETVERMDREAQEIFETGSVVLRAVINAPDLRAALEAQGDKVGESFMLVLTANMSAAQHSGQTELLAQLEAINALAIDVIQARLSPEERFINELLLTETPRDATTLLRKNSSMITPPFVKTLNELAETQEKAGNKPIADRLRQLGREAGAMLF